MLNSQLMTLTGLQPDLPASILFAMSPEGTTAMKMTITSADPADRVIGIAYDPAYTVPLGELSGTKAKGMGMKCYSENVYVCWL